MLQKSNRASHIDPPASSYAIMRRASPTAERTLDPARMFAESLTAGPELENSQGSKPACYRVATLTTGSPQSADTGAFVHMDYAGFGFLAFAVFYLYC
jgi:hypothetical protein